MQVLAGTVFQNKGHAPGGADPLNGRRGKGKGDPLRKLAEIAVEAGDNGRCLFLRPLPFGPFLEFDEEKAAVGVAHIT